MGTKYFFTLQELGRRKWYRDILASHYGKEYLDRLPLSRFGLEHAFPEQCLGQVDEYWDLKTAKFYENDVLLWLTRWQYDFKKAWEAYTQSEVNVQNDLDLNPGRQLEPDTIEWAQAKAKGIQCKAREEGRDIPEVNPEDLLSKQARAQYRAAQKKAANDPNRLIPISEIREQEAKAKAKKTAVSKKLAKKQAKAKSAPLAQPGKIKLPRPQRTWYALYQTLAKARATGSWAAGGKFRTFTSYIKHLAETQQNAESTYWKALASGKIFDAFVKYTGLKPGTLPRMSAQAIEAAGRAARKAGDEQEGIRLIKAMQEGLAVYHGHKIVEQGK